jgi:hypothetical protein
MKTLTTVLCLTAAAFLAGCEKATVSGEPVKKVETTTQKKESMGGDTEKQEVKTTVKETTLTPKLTLTKPSGVTLRRGETDKVDIKIGRENLTGDVRIKFDKLPKGVEIVDADQRLVGDKATFTLRALGDADIVNDFNAQVTAIGPDGMAVSEPFEITIKEAK